MREKSFARLLIKCPVCENKESKIPTMVINQDKDDLKNWPEYITCEECGAMYKLVHPKLKIV